MPPIRFPTAHSSLGQKSSLFVVLLVKAMAGLKRTYHEMDAKGATQLPSPFLPMFEKFRQELDEHHDRRDRVIKASKDITAYSKKVLV